MKRILLFLLVVLSASVYAQAQRAISGKVTDDTGAPLSGVTVVVHGEMRGVVTDMDGNYTMKDVKPENTLDFAFIGFNSQSVLVGNRKNINVTLKSDEKKLDEVVVIGYGTQKRKDVTTAVSSVSTEDISARPITSSAQAIQGKAAGVQVVQPSGAPGADMVVRIRGNTSLTASNDPLYVVDGVPMADIKGLAPGDIESMDILKDASSAAIYGSRGANGVVLITTKRGKDGIAKITLNSYVGVSKVARTFQSLNTAQYRDLMDETGYISLPANLTDQTDWFAETFKTGINQNYQISVSNGNDKMKYYVSGGYTGDKGIINTTFFNRYNLRANLENQVRSWLKMNIGLAYADYVGNDITTGQGANRGGVVLGVINTPTYAPIMDPNNPTMYNANFYGANVSSPVQNMNTSRDNRNKNNRFTGTGSATIHFLPELQFQSTLSMDRIYSNNTRWYDPFTTAFGVGNGGSASDERILNTVMTFDNMLTYTKAFGKHNLSLLGGTSGTTSLWERSYQSANYFRSSDIHTTNAGNKIDPNSTLTEASDWAIMSYLGRAAYNYESKYLLTVNMRADGSSRLNPNHRWGYFPSMSAGWRISSENFMKNAKAIDDLKLRVGWGKTGNQARSQTGNQAGLGDYAYLQQNDIHRQNWWEQGKGTSTVTFSPSNIRNKDLTWETTTQSNIGVDLTMLNHRITFSADAYYKYTNNLIMQIQMDIPSPNTMYRNEGTMSNKGVEFSLSTENIKHNNFTWNSQLNISINRNELKSLSLSKIYYYAQTSDISTDKVVRLAPGEPVGMFWGYRTAGVDPETGDVIYLDKNGNHKNGAQINPTDKCYIGNPNPKFTFGLTNDFTYKNFNLSLFFTGSYGNDIYNASRIETEGMYNAQNQTTKVLDRWRRPGMITTIPRAGNPDNLKASDRWVEDGSYIRLKSFTLSYNVKCALLTKWGISKLQPYCTSQNLLTLTRYSGFDPEVNQWGNNSIIQGIDWGSYPQTRTFIAGINVEF